MQTIQTLNEMTVSQELEVNQCQEGLASCPLPEDTEGGAVEGRLLNLCSTLVGLPSLGISVSNDRMLGNVCWEDPTCSRTRISHP